MLFMPLPTLFFLFFYDEQICQCTGLFPGTQYPVHKILDKVSNLLFEMANFHIFADVYDVFQLYAIF